MKQYVNISNGTPTSASSNRVCTIKINSSQAASLRQITDQVDSLIIQVIKTEKQL